MDKETFINEIAKYVQGWIQAFKFGVPSAIIAQACLESAFGTSDKALRHNYFGLKFRMNRVQCNSGVFTDTSYEQKPDGTYVPIVTQWYSFPDMNFGVEGYFQFIDSGNYGKAKSATTPESYLQALKDCGYATSINYVQNLLNVIDKYDLRRFDGGTTMKPDSPLARLLINSPTTYGLRPCKIDRVTIHHMGCCPSPSAEDQCKRFADKSRRASANYCIGNDGDIVQGLLEAYAPCTSSNKANDLRAITFEVANEMGSPYWTISALAMNSLVALLVDICRRNGFDALVWSDNKNDRIKSLNGANMTLHCDFSSTLCPGPFLKQCMANIASLVTAQLDNPKPSSGYIINGYDYSPVFNPEYYANRYPDVEGAFGHDANLLWQHFEMFGMVELRQGSENFNPEYYKATYEDLRDAFGDENPMYYWHYIAFGMDEGRSGIG